MYDSPYQKDQEKLFTLYFQKRPVIEKITRMWSRWDAISKWGHFFVILQFEPSAISFLTFYSLFGPKNQNFWKMENMAADIIIFHKWTKNHNHIMCSSSLQGFCPFWAIFALLPLFWPKKSKFLKNEKNGQETLYHYISVPKIMTIWCTVP